MHFRRPRVLPAVGLIAIVVGIFLYQNMTQLPTEGAQSVTWDGSPRIVGGIQSIKNGSVVGWALNPRDQTRPVDVSLVLDGTKVAEAPANQPNELTSTAFCSSCAKGYTLRIPQSYLSGLHIVQVQASFQGQISTIIGMTQISSGQAPSAFGIGSMSGGIGDDTYSYKSGDGRFSIYDTLGHNKLVCQGITGVCSPTDSGLIVYFNDGNWLKIQGKTDTMDISSCVPTDPSCVELHLAGNSTPIQLPEGQTTYNGTDNPEVIRGTTGDDTLNGLGGDDTLAGMAGNDTINGNMGHDIVRGGRGNDTLYGGKDNDILLGDKDNDHLEGNLGDDTFYYRPGDGDDEILDVEGNNSLICLGIAGSARMENGSIKIEFEEGGSIRLLGETASHTDFRQCLK